MAGGRAAWWAAGMDSADPRIFLAGAAAGLCEGVVVQPMEMVKTRFQ